MSHVLVVVIARDYLYLFVSLLNFILGFGLDLRSGDLSASKEQPQCVTLPLGSGVVSYRSHKIHFSTCSTFPVGIGTSDSLR